MIYVFLAEGFEETEAITPIDMLRRCGKEVLTVGVTGKVVRGSHNIPVECDITIDEADVGGLELIVLPGGMPGNMTNLMKQAQRMQRQMEEKTKELEEKQYTATAGGGAVSVTVSGKKEVVAVKISPEAVDPDDVEMLEDLIVAATNEAFHQMEAESSAVMSELTGGLGNLGGLSF